MGWKNVKEYYGIKHIVCVTEKGICIGSPYVHDLMVIADSDRPREWRDEVDRHQTKLGCNLTLCRPKYLGRGEPFDGFAKAMADDPETLRRLIDAPDTFEKSITVYTYKMGEILEKKCEKTDWPNVTHDGCLMHKNTYSTNRKKVVKWARDNAKAGMKSISDNIERVEKEQEDRRRWRDEYAAALKQLESEKGYD